MSIPRTIAQVPIYSAAALLCLFTLSCHVARFSQFRGEKLPTDRATLATGKELAQKYCGTCHLVPQPETMTQQTANYMLAYMGLFLGIDASRQLDDAERLHFRTRYEYLSRSGSIPAQAALSPGEWQNLRAYYLALARYPFTSTEPAMAMSLKPVPFTDQGVTMLVRLTDGTLAVGGGVTGTLFFFDSALRPFKRVQLDSAPVHLVERPEGYYVLTLGSLLGTLGANATSSLYFIDRASGSSHTMTRMLPRSAHFVMADLDADGKEDFIIAGFGSVTGGGIFACVKKVLSCTIKILSRQNSVVRLALLPPHGAVTRFLALSGGAREELLLVEYELGLVRETKLVEYPPHLGSVWLEVTDLERDGENEILVLSGDNADAGPYNEVKPDQGLRIYHWHDGKLRQKAFVSLPGALSLTLATHAGRQIIAVARFYTDPESGQDVTLLLPEKKLHFQRRHFRLDSRPTVLVQGGTDALVVGCGNLPVTTLTEGQVRLREFTGPVLGLMQIPQGGF